MPRILSHSAVKEKIDVNIFSLVKIWYLKICVYQELGQTFSHFTTNQLTSTHGNIDMLSFLWVEKLR